MTEADPHGKMLWDAVKVALAGQADDQAALTGRAKDFLSIATISTTITGVILNDKLFKVDQIRVPGWWIVLAAISLAMVYGAGICALMVRKYSFAPDAADFLRVEQESAQASEGELYRAMAEGYLLPGEKGKSELDQNQAQVRRIARWVSIETIGLVALGTMAFVLAFLVERSGVT